MAIFLAVILLLVVVIFGAASIMQSHAAAKQAEAVIETAKVAQMATFANVMVIVLVVVVVLALLAAAVFVFAKRQTPRPAATPRRYYPERPLRLEVSRQNGILTTSPLELSDAELRFLEEERAEWEAMFETPLGIFPEDEEV